MTKKWCFLTSVTKRVLGSIKRLLEYDIEYNGTPSGNYGLVTTCPQHTSRGGVKNFFLLIFLPKTWFFSMIFQKIGAREVKNCRKIEKNFYLISLYIFFKKFKKMWNFENFWPIHFSHWNPSSITIMSQDVSKNYIHRIE